MPEPQPKAYSHEEFGSLSAYALLAEAVSPLLDAAHTAAISQLVESSNERIWSLERYARVEEPASYLAFRRFGASAFTHETIQDLKHHASAYEIYVALRGSFRIRWKLRETAVFQSIDISARGKPWALIPPEHCLLVVPADEAEFLAVAFKTELSKIGVGKFLGSECGLFKKEECQQRQVCEELRTNRKRFFDTVDRARQEAVKEVHKKAASL